MSVYFARVGHLVKVGYSANAERRFANLHRSTTPVGRVAGQTARSAARSA